MSNSIKKIIVRAFFVVACVVTIVIPSFTMSRPFKYRSENDFETYFGSFYSGSDERVDAVFLGDSNVYAFFQPPFAYGYTGIKVRTFSYAKMPVSIYSNFIDLISQYYGDVLYLVALNDVSDDEPSSQIAVDNLPDFGTKVKFVGRLLKEKKISMDQFFRLMLPIISSHSLWSEGLYDAHESMPDFKGGSTYGFLRISREVNTEEYWEDCRELPEKLEREYREFLDYCSNRELRVLFVQMPQLNKRSRTENVNKMRQMAEEAGFPVLDLYHCADEIGLIPKQDYYNNGHTNIIGAKKVSNYIAEWLVQNYGFEDRRGIDTEWDRVSTEYFEYYRDVLE